MNEAFLAEVEKQDRALSQSGIEIWLGSEPTFTNRTSQEPCWLSEAVGGEKEAHARALLLALAPHLAGPVQLLRVEGRTYPGELQPRFCYGALFNRRGRPSNHAPASVSLDPDELPKTPQLAAGEAWLTVTPDPAVVEVNMAPAHDLRSFALWASAVYRAAESAGLSPLRYRYNGELTDSGGGGQITLGGPTPEQSPFFVWPQLLPGLVRYVNRHPALSYLFAPPCCGSASQGPRADEGVRERFDELPVALDYLAGRGDQATPSELWSTLGPLLVDASGCSHRAELNVEKLWDPWFAGRGQLGLVELRALRMPPTPERLTAIAALFRAIAARLAKFPYLEPPIDWGAQLHETRSLPVYLEYDLLEVLADLDAHGFGLGPLLRAELSAQSEPIARVAHGPATLEVSATVQFWPLLGDAVTHSTQGARLVDSSITRLQLLVSAPRGVPLGQLGIEGWRVPLQPLTAEERAVALTSDAQGVRVAGRDAAVGSVLYRAFLPRLGLHPSIPAHDPLVIEWNRGSSCVKLKLHAWDPDAGVYDGLPRAAAEAKARRQARVIQSKGPARRLRHAEHAQNVLDLRRVPRDA
jgi:uncharacterized protein (DUF2126 family)